MKHLYHSFFSILMLSFLVNAQVINSDYFKKNIEIYFKFDINSKDELREITRIISIDNVKNKTVYAYANENEYHDFLRLGIKHELLQSPGTMIKPEMSSSIEKIYDWSSYPTYDAYVAMMNQFAANYPSICQLVDAGQTVQGRNILLVKISDNVSTREAEPQFLYTSTIHGDETTGFVLMLRLIDSLLTGYGTNPRITNIVNNAEIWINPAANPDGTYHGGNSTVYGSTRYNANGYDLNRNFPDPIYGVNTNQQPETQIFRTLAEQNNFVLCANFHGGAEVVNYPWDSWTGGYPDYTIHPDDVWYKFISHLYADTCRAQSPSTYMDGYDNGVTNGGDWYVITGGRQDYMNWYMKSREVTIELSDTKLLSGTLLPAHWEYNKRSFLNYIESIFYGVRGIVTDNYGSPLNATVKVLSHDTLNSEIRTDSLYGNYYRMLAPGTYSLNFSSPGHTSKTIDNVVVSNFNATELNVELISDIIPVELASFTANTSGNEVHLSWATASEKNNYGFEVEGKKLGDRSQELEWETISFIDGHGTTTETNYYTFVEKELPAGKYSYRLKQIDYDGSFKYSDVVEVEIGLPDEFSLLQNYPNPFNPTTKIRYSISTSPQSPPYQGGEAKQGWLVQLKVYNVLGKEVATLVNEQKPAGNYTVEFNASNLSSGIYYYKLQAGNYSEIKKMILLK